MNENDNSSTLNLLKELEKELDNVSKFIQTKTKINDITKYVKRIYTAEDLLEKNRLNTKNLPLNINRLLDFQNKRVADANANSIQNSSSHANLKLKKKSLHSINIKDQKLLENIYYVLDDVKKEIRTDSFHSSTNTISSKKFVNSLNVEEQVPIDTKRRKFLEKFNNLLKVYCYSY